MGIIMAVAQHHGNYKLQLFCGSANFKRRAAEEDPVKYCTRSCKYSGTCSTKDITLFMFIFILIFMLMFLQMYNVHGNISIHV